MSQILAIGRRLANTSRRRLRWLILPLLVVLPVLGLLFYQAHRPLPPSPVQFVDVADAAGVHFRHVFGGSGHKFMPETVGSGGAFLDYNNDGWLDIFLVNSAPLPGFRSESPILSALFRNNKDGTFTNVTEGSGLEVEMYGMGCAVGDYDADGFDDIFVSAVLGSSHLFHNEGGTGKFKDVTLEAGVDDRGGWGTSTAWLDYDNDGYLDLFVCNYVKYTIEDDAYFRNPLFGQSYGLPQFFDPFPAVLYHNRGDGTFEDVTKKAKIGVAQGKALGVCTCDVDRDGWVDLFVANDMVPNHLFRNRGDGTFENISMPAGVAVDASGHARAGMGIDYADFRNDGRLAFLIGTFSEEDDYFFVELSPLAFEDRAKEAGFTSRPDVVLTFGLVFFDYDNDGWRDVFMANGHILDDIQKGRPNITFPQRNQLYHNNRDGTFSDVSRQCGAPFDYMRVSRGCAYGDYDNDGDLDLLVTNNNGPAELLRNDGGNAHNWLQVRLIGKKKSNPNAFGAEVRVTAGGVMQRDWLRSGGSYLVQNMPRLHFGLGDAPRVEHLEVRWPAGKVERFSNLPVNQLITVVEGPPP
ncbi:MAG: CRTAC1 family protein [Armatimonadetes bacterium]|nr:CRTAC1 family protein [Armatimonadota bacterium]